MKAIVTGIVQATEQDLSKLESMGLEITLHRDEHIPPENAEQYEAAICSSLFLYDDISRYTNLKYIQLASAGMDRVPLDYIREHGIELHNAAAVYNVPMAEFAVCGILQIYKQSAYFRKNQEQALWKKHRGLIELAGKTVCILGCGDVGRESAKRLKAFDCRVIGINRTVKPVEGFDTVLGLDELKSVLPEADIFIAAVALTPQTRGIVSRDVFDVMKPGAVFVNVARGALADEDALTDWLESGRSGGAVLDVFENEPLSPDSPLWAMDNVIITPHNSFIGENDHTRLMNVVLRNLEDRK